jgi:hypothetical protein
MAGSTSCPTVNDAMSDSELRRIETTVTHGNKHYIPSFPQAILQAVVEADAVITLPLILAIHRQLAMTQRDDTPLNEAIWRCAGSPPHKRRATILRKLKSLPSIIRIVSARTAITHYRVSRGDLWANR